MDGDLILSLYFTGRGRLLCSGGCEGSCLHARLSVSGSSNTNTAAASCAMLRKETETSGLCLKQLRGLRRAAPWAGCAMRAAQHLRPSRLPLPFPEPCNWDAEDGLSKAEPPGTQGVSLSCGCFVRPSAGLAGGALLMLQAPSAPHPSPPHWGPQCLAGCSRSCPPPLLLSLGSSCPPGSAPSSQPSFTTRFLVFLQDFNIAALEPCFIPSLHPQTPLPTQVPVPVLLPQHTPALPPEVPPLPTFSPCVILPTSLRSLPSMRVINKA